MNEIIRNLSIENFQNLKASFDTSKKIFWDEEKNRLVHAGEYGTYREELIKRWLRMYIPKRFDISSGFIINSENKISTQCDIVIYDRDNTPQIESQERQRFFPAETVAIVIEVKSDIKSAAELNNHLKKLSEIKKLREEGKYIKALRRRWDGNIDFKRNSFDNIATILICNKLDFDLTNNRINYDCEPRHKHNTILSLHDGILSYQIGEGHPLIPVPFNKVQNLFDTIVKNNGEEFPDHLSLFLIGLHMLIDFTTILELDMAYYYSNKIFGKT
jgi:hypothetical protein